MSEIGAAPTGELPVAAKRQRAASGGVLRDDDGTALACRDVGRVASVLFPPMVSEKLLETAKSGVMVAASVRTEIAPLWPALKALAVVKPGTDRLDLAPEAVPLPVPAIGDRQRKARAFDVVDLPDVGAIGDDDGPVAPRYSRAGPPPPPEAMVMA